MCIRDSATTDSRNDERLKRDCMWSRIASEYVYEDYAVFVEDINDYVDEDELERWGIVYSTYHEAYYTLDSVTYNEEDNDYYLNETYNEKFNNKQETTETNISDSELQLQLF